MKQEGLGAQKQYFRGLRIGARGGGSGGLLRRGLSPGHALYLEIKAPNIIRPGTGGRVG